MTDVHQADDCVAGDCEADATVLRAPDGAALWHRRWSPAAAPSRPDADRVLLVHGLGEHGGRYDALARALVASGRRVDCIDLRGHGRSDGARGALPGPRTLFEDLALLIDAVDGGARRVLVGHSLGGAIAARFTAEGLRDAGARAAWYRPIDALALSSPALDPGLSGVRRWLVHVLRRTLPTLAVGNGLDPSWVSSDPAVVAAYRADPLVHDRITPMLAAVMLDAGQATLARAPHWQVPTLLMWAGADRCVRPQGSERFAASAPQGVVSPVCWPGMAHEIFNEPARDAVLARLIAWLDAPHGQVRGD
ncbi:MAG: lysophospholipase [Lautropia sp.]